MKVKCPMRKLGSMATLILIPATWLASYSNFLVALISLSCCNLVDLLIFYMCSKQSTWRPLKMLVSAVLSDKRPDEVPQVY
jgi:hypothetical protein